MAKQKKYLVELNGTKPMEAAIVALGGAPYDESKRVQQGLLGHLYSMRCSFPIEHENESISTNLRPEEFALVENVAGFKRLK